MTIHPEIPDGVRTLLTGLAQNLVGRFKNPQLGPTDAEFMDALERAYLLGASLPRGGDLAEEPRDDGAFRWTNIPVRHRGALEFLVKEQIILLKEETPLEIGLVFGQHHLHPGRTAWRPILADRRQRDWEHSETLINVPSWPEDAIRYLFAERLLERNSISNINGETHPDRSSDFFVPTFLAILVYARHQDKEGRPQILEHVQRLHYKAIADGVFQLPDVDSRPPLERLPDWHWLRDK